jgi:hypothetical protein
LYWNGAREPLDAVGAGGPDVGVIGRGEVNLYALLQSFGAASATVIGTVAWIDGEYVGVTLLGGEELGVTGATSVGERVFVRDGEIVGQAPDLAGVEIEV